MVHDASYTGRPSTARRAELPRDAPRQGGRRRGVLALEGLEHDRLAHGRDRRERRGGLHLLEAQDQHRLGDVRGDSARDGRRARPDRRARCRRSTSAAATSCAKRSPRSAWTSRPKGHDLCLGAGSGGPHLGVVLRARAGGVGRGRLARRLVRRNGEGFFRISLTVPDERLAEAVERLREASGASRCTTAASSRCRACSSWR